MPDQFDRGRQRLGNVLEHVALPDDVLEHATTADANGNASLLDDGDR